MVQIEGGNQALRRTISARLEITAGETTTISVPGPFGALLFKAGAFRADSRDPQRHLYDATLLLACIEDPYAERDRFRGSDRQRVQLLARTLTEDHLAWTLLDTDDRIDARAALRLLVRPD